MASNTIQGKLGNMKKADQWMPLKLDSVVILFGTTRVARVNLDTGKAELTSSKSRYNKNNLNVDQIVRNFRPEHGGVVVDVPVEIMTKLR